MGQLKQKLSWTRPSRHDKNRAEQDRLCAMQEASLDADQSEEAMDHQTGEIISGKELNNKKTKRATQAEDRNRLPAAPKHTHADGSILSSSPQQSRQAAAHLIDNSPQTSGTQPITASAEKTRVDSESGHRSINTAKNPSAATSAWEAGAHHVPDVDSDYWRPFAVKRAA